MVRDAGFAPLTLDALEIAESPEEDAIEAFDTFEENARAKALWYAARAGGRLVLADDSGLCVDALGGAPGVRSKRWSEAAGLSGQRLDDANNARLLRELERQSSRRARYVCVVVIAAGGVEFLGRGESTGTIIQSAKGENGFGYDPYFLSDELGMTFGEATTTAKQRISHRGRAVRAALQNCAASS